MHRLEKRLMSRLVRQHAGYASRFWFSPRGRPHLAIEPIDPIGRRAFSAVVKKVFKPGDFLGGLEIDPRNGRFLFFGPTTDEAFLAALATWARTRLDVIPGLSRLADSEAALLDVNNRDDAALLAVDPAALKPQSNPDLWEGFVEPRIQDVAHILDSRFPGEKMWFWLWPEAPPGSPMLLLQPCKWDPTMDRLERLIARAAPDGDAGSLTGMCRFDANGVLQFRGRHLDARALGALAGWVEEHQAEHPGLAHLAGAEFVVIWPRDDDTSVADTSLWAGVSKPLFPTTAAETASVLAGLSVGQDAWFWLTPAGSDGPFLTLCPVEGDRRGEKFQARLRYLRLRFPEAGSMTGLARLLPSSRFLFTTTQGPLGGWSDKISALISQHEVDWPDFAALRGARLVCMNDGGAEAAAHRKR